MKKPLSVKIAFVVRIAVWLAVAIVFFFGSAWIRSEVGSCFWRDHFGFLCPGCGGTRALVSLLHLDFSRAFHYNEAFTCGLYPALFLFFALDTVLWLFRLAAKRKVKTPLEYLFSVLDRQKEQEGPACSI